MAAFKLDTREFDRTLSKYSTISKRDRVEIVNTKGFFIARAAIRNTPKADSNKIRKFFNKSNAKIVGMIINAKRKAKGLVGLSGLEMEAAQLTMRNARLRSVAFLKSGWIPAAKGFEKLTKYRRGVARNEVGEGIGRAKQVGRLKGNFSPARDGAFLTVAKLINMAGDNKDNKGALHKFGGPALQLAINQETESMRVYIEGKMKSAADAAGIKTN